LLKKRRQWIRKRFGNIDDKILGQIKEANKITSPDILREYEVKGHTLKWQMVREIDISAERVAEIYRNGIDELVGNSEYEWHHNPEEIIKKVKTGDWNIYGCYYDEKLISVVSMHIIRGQRAIQWIWGAVDPVYRGLGVWHHSGEYLDLVTEKSGAQMGFFFVVTTHKYSQQSVEKAGFKPIGFFIGGEFMGGSDNRYYRQNVVYYGKLYGDGKKFIQKCETMELTEKAEELFKTVKKLWTA
jgi:RimJ/RimL family protein N-acetyltransferase